MLVEVNRHLLKNNLEGKKCNRTAFELGGLKLIDFRQMQMSLLLHWAVKSCRAQPLQKWNWTPNITLSWLS